MYSQIKFPNCVYIQIQYINQMTHIGGIIAHLLLISAIGVVLIAIYTDSIKTIKI